MNIYVHICLGSEEGSFQGKRIFIASTLNTRMQAICSSERSGSLRPTRRYNQEDRTFHNHCRQNLKFCLAMALQPFCWPLVAFSVS
jgi:hypothetical protein